ncbi:hypothetical protein X801_04826 [Opisthorchis viverrini]|uniref:Uncharacterized protein n=1 Tax=Opisthorchis viverrini TaxID=6198 RepID=A0A1S8WXX5_OPIVI|nr:hypothetical protein X801_04826 [Opisthorchis viverrini]
MPKQYETLRHSTNNPNFAAPTHHSETSNQKHIGQTQKCEPKKCYTNVQNVQKCFNTSAGSSGHGISFGFETIKVVNASAAQRSQGFRIGRCIFVIIALKYSELQPLWMNRLASTRESDHMLYKRAKRHKNPSSLTRYTKQCRQESTNNTCSALRNPGALSHESHICSLKTSIGDCESQANLTNEDVHPQ